MTQKVERVEGDTPKVTQFPTQLLYEGVGTEIIELENENILKIVREYNQRTGDVINTGVYLNNDFILSISGNKQLKYNRRLNSVSGCMTLNNIKTGDYIMFWIKDFSKWKTGDD